MSNPSGDALMAIGIRDTQNFSRGEIRSVLADDRRTRKWEIAAGLAAGIVLMMFFVL